MRGLTNKQRVKVNAALSVIHAMGYDANEVTAQAKAIMATGHDARTAYERALNQFAGSNQETADGLRKITRLVEASDAQTVAQYDHALNEYIATGSEAALDALAPTIAADSIALAIHLGEMTEADVAGGGLAMALGFEPAPEMAAVVAELHQPASSSISNEIGLSTEPAADPKAVEGYRAPHIEARLQRNTAPANPGTNGSPWQGMPPAAAREAAMASVMHGSRVVIDTAGEPAA